MKKLGTNLLPKRFIKNEKLGTTFTSQIRHYIPPNRARKLFAHMKRYYARRAERKKQSKMHGWDHVLPVAEFCVVLTRDAGGTAEEQELAFVAGLLHDACRIPESREGKKIDKHELWGAQFAKKLLPRLGYDERETKTIAEAIASHSFSSTPKGEKKVAPSRGLVAWALKAADKKEQYEPRTLWRRGVFIGESLNETPSFETIVAYWKSRIENCDKFLRQPGGKMLKKSFPKSLEGLGLIKEYFKRMLQEKNLAEKLGLEKELEIAGALGITLYCFDAGRKGAATEQARKGYAKKLGKFSAKMRKKRYSARQKQVLRDALRFSMKVLKATPLQEVFA